MSSLHRASTDAFTSEIGTTPLQKDKTISPKVFKGSTVVMVAIYLIQSKHGCLAVCTFVADMVIGFTERRTVSECAGVDLFLLKINVSSLRPSERQYHMEFHIVESRTNATVETLVPTSNIYDATFGFRANLDDPIEVTRDLPLGERTISPLLQTAIRNDIIPEETECFTIRIWPVDLSGRHVLFDCNYGYLDVDSYFCEHTICIEDNDGRCFINSY